MEQPEYQRCPEGWIEELWLERTPDGQTWFTIPLVLEDTATRLCAICGGRTRKQYMRYDSPYRAGERLLVARSDKIPGWACTRCGAESYDPEAARLALEAVGEIVREAGDAPALERVEAALESRSPAS